MGLDWDAAVVVLRRRNGKVLGVTRGRDLDDLNPPGGQREPQDLSPLDTARRELLEETGVLLLAAYPIGSWVKGGRRVVAFEGSTWIGELRPSEEGVPVWVHPSRLVRKTCTYQGRTIALLSRQNIRKRRRLG